MRRRPAPARLMVLGDLVLDVVVAPAAELVAGSDTPGSVRFRAGGSAANTARAFAGLGGDTVFVGAIGDDGAGRVLKAALRRDGVTARTVVHAAPTARLAVQLGADGERSFITQRGAANLLEPADLAASWFRDVRALHLPLYSLLSEPLGSAARRAVELVRGGVGWRLVSVDLASVGPIRAHGVRAVERLVRLIGPDILFANAAEAELFGARTWPARLVELAPIVVVKQGAGGCEVLVRSGGAGAGADATLRRFTVATRPLATTDTTGAGDAFDAGFLRSLLVEGPAGGVPGAFSAARLRSAAVAGNRTAGKLLATPRTELGW